MATRETVAEPGPTTMDVDERGGRVDAPSMAPHLALRKWWSETKAGVVTRETPEAEIAELEARYDVAIPHEFRRYLAEGAPVAESWDVEHGNWWPVARIRNISDEYPHPLSQTVAANAGRHLVFLDHMAWSWAWAISCADDETRGKVALIGGLPDGYVADGFAQFVDGYIGDWGSISRVPTDAQPSDRL